MTAPLKTVSEWNRTKSPLAAPLYDELHLRILAAEKKRHKQLYCVICGQFLRPEEAVLYHYEPDSHFGPEVIQYAHRHCKLQNAARSPNSAAISEVDRSAPAPTGRPQNSESKHA